MRAQIEPCSGETAHVVPRHEALRVGVGKGIARRRFAGQIGDERDALGVGQTLAFLDDRERHGFTLRRPLRNRTGRPGWPIECRRRPCTDASEDFVGPQNALAVDVPRCKEKHRRNPFALQQRSGDERVVAIAIVERQENRGLAGTPLASFPTREVRERHRRAPRAEPIEVRFELRRGVMVAKRLGLFLIEDAVVYENQGVSIMQRDARAIEARACKGPQGVLLELSQHDVSSGGCLILLAGLRCATDFTCLR
jgi:hypothetical protein